MQGNKLRNLITPEEIKVIVMSLEQTIDDLKETAGYKWNAQALKMRQDMQANAESALVKISEMAGGVSKMEPYKPGDEKEFLESETGAK